MVAGRFGGETDEDVLVADRICVTDGLGLTQIASCHPTAIRRTINLCLEQLMYARREITIDQSHIPCKRSCMGLWSEMRAAELAVDQDRFS